MAELLWHLLVGHVVADYPLQTEFIAAGKARKTNPYAAFVPWYYILAAHAIVHGGAVSLITGVWWLGIFEAGCHFQIDYGKCEGWYGIHTDQAMHLGCKGIWAHLV